VVDEVAGIADWLKHIRRRLGELHVAYGPEVDEEDQLERAVGLTARTEIRSAIDSAREGLEPIESFLGEVETLAMAEGET
jgi:hypothetical protein